MVLTREAYGPRVQCLLTRASRRLHAPGGRCRPCSGGDCGPATRSPTICTPCGCLEAAFGYETYIAWHGRLSALVVAKLVQPGGSDPDMRDGLRREATMLRGLAHPMLPRMFGAVLSGERPHIVLELPRGSRLSSLIRPAASAITRCSARLWTCAASSQYLADRGVAHLAVQPPTIVLATQPCLCDFARAWLTAEARSPQRAPGGDPYLAPEQCDPRRFGEIGYAADVWGLGATLHEALSGRHPFPQDGAAFPQLRAAPRRLPNHVPGHVAVAIRACLATRPADRPTARELADALAPMASEPPPGGGRPLHPLPYADHQPPGGAAMRSGRLTAIALAAVLTAGGIGTALARLGDDDPATAADAVEGAATEAAGTTAAREGDDGDLVRARGREREGDRRERAKRDRRDSAERDRHNGRDRRERRDRRESERDDRDRREGGEGDRTEAYAAPAPVRRPRSPRAAAMRTAPTASRTRTDHSPGGPAGRAQRRPTRHPHMRNVSGTAHRVLTRARETMSNDRDERRRHA